MTTPYGSVHPCINNSGEVVWALNTGGIYSSIRGQLSTTGTTPHIANSGEVVYADRFEGPLEDLVSTKRGRLTLDGQIDPGLSEFGIQSSGEIVYAVKDTNNFAQVYSTVRGQITTDSTDHLHPCINDSGEIVWLQNFNQVVSSTRGLLPSIPGVYGAGPCVLRGLGSNGDVGFTGNLVNTIGWTWPHIMSSAHGAIISDPNKFQYEGGMSESGSFVYNAAGAFFRADWVTLPVLSLVQYDQGLALEWPTNADAFHAQYTTNIALSNAWTRLNTTITTNGDHFVQFVGPGHSSVFFQLSGGAP